MQPTVWAKLQAQVQRVFVLEGEVQVDHPLIVGLVQHVALIAHILHLLVAQHQVLVDDLEGIAVLGGPAWVSVYYAGHDRADYGARHYGETCKGICLAASSQTSCWSRRACKRGI